MAGFVPDGGCHATFILPLVLAACVLCERDAVASAGRDVQGDVRAASAAVYDLVLLGTFHGTPGRRMVVKNRAVPMRPLRNSNAEWMKSFDGVPAELLARAAQPPAPGTTPFTARDFPEGTRLVDEAAIRTLFVTPDGQPGPAAVARDIAGWLALSDVLYTADGRDALVYYEGHCGGLCGEGGYIWVHRDDRTGNWRLARKVVGWQA